MVLAHYSLEDFYIVSEDIGWLDVDE